MRPHELLFAKATEEGITVAGLYDRTITILGTSVPLSARIGDSVDAFTATPTKPGVIAVVIRIPGRGKGGSYPTDVSFLLAVEKADVGFRVNTDTPWVCSGRLGQITDHSHVQVRIGDEYFVPMPEYDYQRKKLDGCRFVEDPNLLCQYLAGDVGAEAVKAAATEHAEEVEARKKLPEVMATLEKEQAITRNQAELLRVFEDQHNKMQNHLQALRVCSDNLRVAVLRQWFKRPSVKCALRAFATP